MNQKLLLSLVAAVALAAGAGFAWWKASGNSTGAPQYFQTFPEPRQLAPVELVNQHGETVTNEVFKDHWSLLFLGYTFCPDVCPTTMSALGQIYPELKDISPGAPIQVVFVSVDPKRDTPERLESYLAYFNPEFVALTGEHKMLFPFARSLGLMYAIAESTDNPNYLVDHSASVVVVDPDGLAIGRFKPKYNPGEVAVSDSIQMLTDLPYIIKDH
ncbi:SCO family protein [Alteromonas lipolytica]|uniref:Electron transporter SenC n=1 Tax=Alteromonas lipolytica TaxID=1856405 RepID=A0A1E8FAT9_9ALTE|nr:SCO family protein [Alteromonas lipolytica]OFI33044.1 electron transporter SenC [Alteromonas lipolytica]GGF63053.1 photosynthetic protein synthase I [Alteromonas lipolytica]